MLIIRSSLKPTIPQHTQVHTLPAQLATRTAFSSAPDAVCIQSLVKDEKRTARYSYCRENQYQKIVFSFYIRVCLILQRYASIHLRIKDASHLVHESLKL